MEMRARLFIVLLVVSIAANILLLTYLPSVSEIGPWIGFIGLIERAITSLKSSQFFTYWIPVSIAAIFFVVFLLNANTVVVKRRQKKRDDHEKSSDHIRGLITLMIEIFTSGKEPALLCASALTVISIQWNVAQSSEVLEPQEEGLKAIESLLITTDTITNEVVDELHQAGIVERARESTTRLEKLVSDLDVRIRTLTNELEDLTDNTDDLVDRVDDSVDDVEDLRNTLVDLEGIVSRLNTEVFELYNLHPLLRRLSPEGE